MEARCNVTGVHHLVQYQHTCKIKAKTPKPVPTIGVVRAIVRAGGGHADLARDVAHGAPYPAVLYHAPPSLVAVELPYVIFSLIQTQLNPELT